MKDMSAMFSGAASFNEDLSHWKVDNVKLWCQCLKVLSCSILGSSNLTLQC